MTDPVMPSEARRGAQDAQADWQLQKVRERIARNMPKIRSPLRWRKVTERIIRSHCGRFQIERRGEGDTTRYFAFIVPDKVIGHRLLTAEAKTICEQHASPLPLDAPPVALPEALGAEISTNQYQGGSTPINAPVSAPVVEREPGCDDDLGEDA